MKYSLTFALLLLTFACAAAGFAAESETPPDEAPASLPRLLLDHPITAVFAVIGLGMLLGSVKIYGVSLGSSGVIFVAIVFGAFGCTLPKELGNFGLVLFVYCVGLSAGPSFFRAFFRSGAELAKLSVLVVASGAAVTVAFALLAGVPAALASGVFAGALTSTPGLAAALSLLNDDPAASIGYGIAYPFGVIGVVLFVQLLPRLLRADLEAEGRKQAASDPDRARIQRMLIEVLNPSVMGRKVHEVPFVNASRCQISRVLQGERLVPIAPDSAFGQGMHVFAVGHEDRLRDLADFLGRRSDRRYYVDTASELMQVVATSPEVVGKSLRELNLINKFGITISRIVRQDIGFIPDADTLVQRADVLYAVGEPEHLKEFAAFAGHRTRVLDETDLISLSAGIIAGVLLGMTPVALPGMKPFTLGLAGGPLLVALVLGHFGGIGRIRGHMPRAARLLMTEAGLVFFLAAAGAKAGEGFLDVLRAHGPLLLFMGALVTTLPMAAGYVFARKVLKLSLLETLGGICGSMTSTPGLGALASHTDSDATAISYATAYPVALILMTVFAQIIVAVLT